MRDSILRQWLCFVFFASCSASFLHAESAGLTAPGGTTYPSFEPFRVSGTEMNGGRDPFNSGVIDITKGYGYFGMGIGTDVGRIYKLKLGTGLNLPTKVGSLTLQSNEVPQYAAIDTASAFAYFVTKDAPSKVIKIALGDGDSEPVRVGTLTLNAGEQAVSCTIDTAGGNLLVGIAGTPGAIVKVALGSGTAVPTRLGSTLLDVGEDSPTSAVMDVAGRYAYFGTNTSPGKVVKVSINDGFPNPVRASAVTLNTGENNLSTAEIDPANNFLYFGTNADPGFLIKLSISAGTAAPVRQAALDVTAASSTAKNFLKSAINTSSGHIYLVSSLFLNSSFVHKIRLNAGNAVPSYLSTYGGFIPGPNANALPNTATASFIDPTTDHGYFGGRQADNSALGFVAKVNLGAGDNPMTKVPIPPNDLGIVGFNIRHDNAIGGAYIASQNRIYTLCLSLSGPVQPVAYNPTPGNAAPTFAKSGSFTSNNGGTCVGIDTVNKTLYSITTDSRLQKAHLRDDPAQINTLIGPIVLPTTGNSLILIDSGPTPTFGYVGTSGGSILKFALNGTGVPSSTGFNAVALGAGPIQSGVLDTVAGFGYFGTSTGNLVKVNLNGSADPVVVATISAAAGHALTTAVVDINAGFAYFGTTTTVGNPALVAKIQLGVGAATPTVVGSATLNSDESSLTASVIDLQAGTAYFGTNSTPGKMVTVNLGAGSALPSRVTALTLPSLENNIQGAAIDTQAGYAYLFCRVSPARIAKVSTGSVGRIRATRMTLNDNASVSQMSFYSHSATGKLRLAIYSNDAPRQLMWQSGEITNTTTNGFINVDISSGTPSALTLPAGAYWLAWQGDVSTPVASFSPGSAGDGFFIPSSFDSFPSTIAGETITPDRWTQFITYAKRPTFRLTGPANWSAGISQNITITAVDRLGVTQTSYTGTKQVILTGASPSVNPVTPPTATATNQPFNQSINVTFTNGVATVPLSLFKAETATLSVSDPALNALTEQALTVTVSAATTPANQSKFVFSGPSTAAAGTPFAITITAQDQFGNVRSASYTGSKNLNFTGAAVSPNGSNPTVNSINFGTSQSIVFTAGVATVSSVRLVKTETAALQASDLTITGQSALSVAVTEGAHASYSLQGNAVQTAGTAQNLTLFALDSFGNVVSGLTGSRTLIFTGANDSPNSTRPTVNGQNFGVPGVPLVFVGGAVSAQMILTRDENASIAASSNGGTINTVTPLAVDVAPAAAASVTLTPTVTTQSQNASQIYTVAAFDTFGNPALGYTGTLAFTSSDPLAVLPASLVFPANTRSLTLRTVGNQAVTVTDTVNASLTTSRIITVNAAAPTSIAVFQGSAQTATVGTAFNTQFKAIVRDGSNNPIAGAGVTFSVSGSGASGTFDGSTSVLTDGNGIATAPTFTANTLPGSYNVVATVNALTTNFALTNTVGAPVSITATAGANQTATISSPFATALTATVRDQFNNPVPNANVTFAVPGAGASGIFGGATTVQTNSFGIATAPTLTSNTIIGAYQAIASVNALSASYSLANVNDAPSFTLAQNTLNISEDAGQQVVELSAITSGSAAHALTFTAFSSDPALIPDNSIVLTDNGDGTGSIRFTPTADLSGSSAITVTLKDNGGTANGGSDTSTPRILTVNIAAVNDAPTLDLPASATVMEDSGASTISLTGISPGPLEASQLLTFTYTSSNTAIIANQATPQNIVGTSALLSFTPLQNAFTPAGTPVTLTITVADNGTPVQTFVRATTVTVLPVNDAPVGTIQNLSVLEQNPLSIVLSGTDVDSTTLTYSVVSTPQHGTLTGTVPNLTYTPEAGYTGPDSFDFKANDGQFDSVAATIFVTVQPNNAKPTVSAISQTTGTVNQTAFNLTVTGTNFVNGAQVLWNGQALTTTFVSPTELSAAVTAVQLAGAGRLPIAVLNPVPQLSTSNTLNFFLYSGSVGTWIVTNTNDAGSGSLRLALASARDGDAIVFDPDAFDLVNSDAETLINVLSELPALDDGNVTIDASDRRVSINGSGAGTARGLVISSSGNTIRGLAILGFTRSGISLFGGAKNNQIGGDRANGSGPNGQGLRISGNGTYGIEILGAGTSGNTVKGCWVGLDAGGIAPEANLAGILLSDGATANTIGSVVTTEENVISGNSLEGVTVAGAGTDDNVIIGNTVGASAAGLAARAASSREEGFVTRTAIGNGSAGVFLSKGARATRSGGTASGEGNNVGFNGGNGFEVRSRDARRNSARANKVTGNARGGIALFDGSNDGVLVPRATSFLRIPNRSTATWSRSAISARVTGEASGNGSVEFFNDSGAQGAVFIGRASVAGGVFEADIDVDDLLNLTATFTDENGNTSPFGFFGRASGNAGSPDDLDGDGFSNTVETLAGTDPSNAAQAPVSAGALAVDTAKIGLNFAAANKDLLSAVVRVALPEGVTLPQATVGLMFSSVTKTFTLDAKLRSPKATSTVKAAQSKTGVGVQFTFSLKSDNLRDGLASSGLTNSTTPKSGEAKDVPVILTLKTPAGNSYAYAGVAKLTYKATQGKIGKAAVAK